MDVKILHTDDAIAELERDINAAVSVTACEETIKAFPLAVDQALESIRDSLEAERWHAEKERRDLLDRLERERLAHTETARFFKATIGNMNDLVNQYRERLKYYVKNGGPNEIN